MGEASDSGPVKDFWVQKPSVDSHTGAWLKLQQQKDGEAPGQHGVKEVPVKNAVIALESVTGLEIGGKDTGLKWRRQEDKPDEWTYSEYDNYATEKFPSSIKLPVGWEAEVTRKDARGETGEAILISGEDDGAQLPFSEDISHVSLRRKTHVEPPSAPASPPVAAPEAVGVQPQEKEAGIEEEIVENGHPDSLGNPEIKLKMKGKEIGLTWYKRVDEGKSYYLVSRYHFGNEESLPEYLEVPRGLSANARIFTDRAGRLDLGVCGGEDVKIGLRGDWAIDLELYPENYFAGVESKDLLAKGILTASDTAGRAILKHDDDGSLEEGSIGQMQERLKQLVEGKKNEELPVVAEPPVVQPPEAESPVAEEPAGKANRFENGRIIETGDDLFRLRMRESGDEFGIRVKKDGKGDYYHMKSVFMNDLDDYGYDVSLPEGVAMSFSLGSNSVSDSPYVDIRLVGGGDMTSNIKALIALDRLGLLKHSSYVGVRTRESKWWKEREDLLEKEKGKAHASIYDPETKKTIWRSLSQEEIAEELQRIIDDPEHKVIQEEPSEPMKPSEKEKKPGFRERLASLRFRMPSIPGREKNPNDQKGPPIKKLPR